MKVGEQLVAVPPPPPRAEQEHRPMDMYMNSGWMNGMPLEGVRTPNPRQPMRNQGLGATENISYFSIGDQQGHKGHHPGWMWFAGRKRRTYGKGWCPTTRPSREPGPSPRSARWSSRESGARSGCTRGKSRTSCTTTASDAACWENFRLKR